MITTGGTAERTAKEIGVGTGTGMTVQIRTGVAMIAGRGDGRGHGLGHHGMIGASAGSGRHLGTGIEIGTRATSGGGWIRDRPRRSLCISFTCKQNDTQNLAS